MIMDSDRCFNVNTLEHRKRVREVYKTEAGQQELFNLLHDLGCFEAIGPEQLDRRDYAIYKLSEIGLLDEKVIRKLLKYFFESDPDKDEYWRLEEKMKKFEEDAKRENPYDIKDINNG